jgi:hypothetical protein
MSIECKQNYQEKISGKFLEALVYLYLFSSLSLSKLLSAIHI